MDIRVPPIVEEIAVVMSSSHAAAHAAPTPVNESVAPARDVAYTTPEISNRTVEQVVDGLEDVDADILRHEQVLHRYQANLTILFSCSQRRKRILSSTRRKQLFFF